VLDGFLARIAPASTLASVQAVWSDVVGPGVAAHGSPVGERDGVLTVTCDEAVWANEIELMGPELIAALNAALGGERVRRVSCRRPGGVPPGARRGGRRG
jgi:predicted nucleic acid-binding Zn ribbon protein